MYKFLFLSLFFFSLLTVQSQSEKILETYEDSVVMDDGIIYQVSLTRYNSPKHDGHEVNILFSLNLENGETLLDRFKLDKDPVAGCEPYLYDYNGDGYLDYSFISDIAARGANEIRTVFIYNPVDRRFFHLKNSDHYPNLIYNFKMKCLDGWAFHGGTTQYILELDSDSLIVNYSIDIHGTERLLNKYDKGKLTEVRTDTIEDVGFIRYSTINPFEE